jgi:SnoaL-like domain
MFYTVSTLLLRNLHDVFGEIDPVRRRKAIDEIFHEDAVFHEPNGMYRGRGEIDRIAGVIKATHPDFRYQPLAPPEVMGDGGRVRWVSGSPGKPPAYAGTDFIIARDGKIATSLTSFRDLDAAAAKVPPGDDVAGHRPCPRPMRLAMLTKMRA